MIHKEQDWITFLNHAIKFSLTQLRSALLGIAFALLIVPLDSLGQVDASDQARIFVEEFSNHIYTEKFIHLISLKVGSKIFKYHTGNGRH